MFCPNCGNNCADANFCSNCGTKLQKKDEEGQGVEQRVWEIPVGVYKVYGGHIALGPTWIEIYKKKNLQAKNHIVRFPYTQLTGVSYGRNHGLEGGFAAVRWEGNQDLPIPRNFGEALRDATSIQTDSPSDLLFYHICCFLYTFVDPLSGDAPVYAREGYDDVSLPEQDLSSYYERYNPYRLDAAEALRENTYMTRKEAARLVDAYFDKRQKAEYAEDASAALRDLNKILRTPENERREQLEAANLAFCPKCLSTSITAQRRGYNSSRALLLRGVQYGMLGMNSVKCICMKCGHTWTPNNK